MVYYIRADYGRHSYPQFLAWMLTTANVRNEKINSGNAHLRALHY